MYATSAKNKITATMNFTPFEVYGGRTFLVFGYRASYLRPKASEIVPYFSAKSEIKGNNRTNYKPDTSFLIVDIKQRPI